MMTSEANKAEKRKVLVSFVYPFLFVLTLWLVEWAEIAQERSFVTYGLFPRTLSGLRGIFLSPFIHSDFNHLFNNSVPLLIMGTALFYFYRKVALRLTLLIIIAGGVWTWISARPSYHIGASGLVYGLFGFLLVSGFIRRHKGLMSLSFLVAFIYGSLVWGVLPIDYNISWEGHLWGLLAGVALAYYFRKQGPQREVHQWEEEDEEDDDESDQSYWQSNDADSVIQVRYDVRKTNETD
jgi:membrane associated rhomboid family serine protease